MSLIDALRTRIHPRRSDADPASLLKRAEQLLHQGGASAEVRALASEALMHLEAAEIRHNGERDLRFAAAFLFTGNLDAAIDHAQTAANARPYDVDSRIIHGYVRLARNELDEAAHEFDAVIEEFGADRDAAAGRRAVILARGDGPFDELPAGDDDWSAAATLLTGLWRICGLSQRRLSALRQAHPNTLELLQNEARRALIDGSDDGTV